jgi:hypothetical protein
VTGPDAMCHCNDAYWDNGSSCQMCSWDPYAHWTCGPTPCGNNNKVCPANYHCWPCVEDGRGACGWDYSRCP